MPIIRAVVDQLYNGKDVKNVLHYDAPDFSATTLQEIADALANAWDDDLASFLDDNWSLNTVTFYDLSIAEPFGQTYIPDIAPVVGSVTGRSLPVQNATKCTFRHNGPKPNRGGPFLSGFSTSATDTTGRVEAAVINAVQLWFLQINDITTTAGPDASLVLYSTVLSSPGSPVTNLVDNMVVSNIFRRQGRRQADRGS